MDTKEVFVGLYVADLEILDEMRDRGKIPSRTAFVRSAVNEALVKYMEEQAEGSDARRNRLLNRLRSTTEELATEVV